MDRSFYLAQIEANIKRAEERSAAMKKGNKEENKKTEQKNWRNGIRVDVNPEEALSKLRREKEEARQEDKVNSKEEK